MKNLLIYLLFPFALAAGYLTGAVADATGEARAPTLNAGPADVQPQDVAGGPYRPLYQLAALDVDAGPLDSVVVADHAPAAKETPPTLPADPIASPGETWTGLRYFYGLGWLPFGLAALCIACAVVAVRMRPADVDGDGLPDPSKSAKGYGWIAASALVVVLPVLAMRIGDVEGITWSLVFNACGAGALLAWGFLQRMGKVTAASKIVSPGGNS